MTSIVTQFQEPPRVSTLMKNAEPFLDEYYNLEAMKQVGFVDCPDIEQSLQPCLPDPCLSQVLVLPMLETFSLLFKPPVHDTELRCWNKKLSCRGMSKHRCRSNKKVFTTLCMREDAQGIDLTNQPHMYLGIDDYTVYVEAVRASVDLAMAEYFQHRYTRLSITDRTKPFKSTLCHSIPPSKILYA